MIGIWEFIKLFYVNLKFSKTKKKKKLKQKKNNKNKNKSSNLSLLKEFGHELVFFPRQKEQLSLAAKLCKFKQVFSSKA